MDLIYAWIKPQWHNRFIIGLGRMTDDDREPSNVATSEFWKNCGRFGFRFRHVSN